MKTCSTLFVCVFSTCLLTSPGHSDEFFRVVTDTNCVITGFTQSGDLSWSNSMSYGSYLIERSLEPDTPEWAPITRGYFSNHLWSVKVYEPNPPAGMAFIPGGQFSMGDAFDELGGNNAVPVHQVIVSPFFIKTNEVTNQQLRDVFQWAYDQGLITVTNNLVQTANAATNALLVLGHVPQGQEIEFDSGQFTVLAGRTNYPCAFITWYGTLAYCNYLGGMEGRELCYNLTNWTCDFTKNGYRLPTEAQWEIAARGGYEGMRFPWGDTNVISHARANYKSDTNYVFDVSEFSGYDPIYGAGWPKSSPVGVFPANNYGLRDMAGNIYEWTWDWYARYSSETQYDPTGAEGGPGKSLRGGSWYTTPERVLVACRYTSAGPYKSIQDVGFRVILPYQP